MAHGTTYPSMQIEYIRLQQVFAGSASVLSILGAFLVIFSFLYDTKASSWREIYYKFCCGYQIRDETKRGSVIGSKYRLKAFNIILIHLSVADIIVAISHLWGLCSNLERNFANYTSEGNFSAGQNANCVTQAAFTVLSTISSFLWTDILAVFLAFNVVFAGCSNNFMTGLKRMGSRVATPTQQNIVFPVNSTQQSSIVFPENSTQQNIVVLEGSSKPSNIAIPGKEEAPHCCESPVFLQVLFPLIGWGIPLLMVVFTAAEDLLGYTDDYDQGWCYYYFRPKSKLTRQRSLVTLLTYEAWLWVSIILVLLCTTVYTVTVCFRRKKSAGFHTNCSEVRYLSVGIAFALLRFPSTVINIYQLKSSGNYRTITSAILNIITATTLSLQGGVNGIIYLCCRSSVKKRCCPSARFKGYSNIA